MYAQPLSDELTALYLQAIPDGVDSVIEVASGNTSLASGAKAKIPGVRYTSITFDQQLFELTQGVSDQVELRDKYTFDDSFFERHSHHQCWILGEILTQIVDPWSFLRSLKRWLPEDGRIIMCMPNAQHWSLQVKLAAGAFHYQDVGLLHKSHLRWFTRETLLHLLDETGLEMSAGQPISSPTPLSEKFLPIIGQIADAAELNVDMAICDATPTHYLVSAVHKCSSPVFDAPRPVLTDEQFLHEDRKTPKNDKVWAFPVCAYDHLLSGNDRAVFEAVRYRADIRKVVLTRSKDFLLEGENVLVVPLASREGQDALIEAGYIFVKHAAAVNAPYPLIPELHRIINLWHGIPLKRIGITSLDNAPVRESLLREHARHHAVIASSKMDQLAMTVAFQPLPMEKIWITGLPRNDVVVCDEHRLPEDFADQLSKLRIITNGRRLVLFAPTFRNGQAASYYSFTGEQRESIKACLERHNAVLGVREHMADRAQSYSAALGIGKGPFISLDRRNFADIEIIYREAEILITDYSSCFIDFMLTGRPQISFAYDRAHYSGQERGMFYNLEDVFPGPVCEDFGALLNALESTLAGKTTEHPLVYAQKRRMFFEHLDDGNSNRLVQRILQEARS